MAQTLTRTFPDGDYVQRLGAAFDAVESAEKDRQKGQAPPLLAGEVDPVEQLAEEYRSLKAEAEADADAKGLVVTLEALGRKVWRELKVKHPPRSGEGVDPETVKEDRLAGVNTDSVADDLVYAAVIYPEFTSRGAFDEWLDGLTEGQFQTLLTDAWQLVNVAQYDPKSLPASRSPRSDTN